MPPLAWLACLMIGLPLVMFLPTHAVLMWWQGRMERLARDPKLAGA